MSEFLHKLFHISHIQVCSKHDPKVSETVSLGSRLIMKINSKDIFNLTLKTVKAIVFDKNMAAGQYM